MSLAKEQYWSRYAKSFDDDQAYILGPDLQRALFLKLREKGDLGRVIELGCGTGYYTRSIAGRADHVLATDLSDEMLDVAASQLARLDNVTVQKADCADTGRPAASFDTVFMANLLNVIPHPAVCLRECHRILRPGGLLLAVSATSHGMGSLAKVGLGFRHLLRWGRPPAGSQTSFSPESSSALARAAGFEVEEAELIVGSRATALYLRARKPAES